MVSCYLSAPLPNEHLLSMLARGFDLSGRNDFLHTVRVISPNVGNMNPALIWRPVYWTIASHYIDTVGWDALLQNHTLVPYYLPFLNGSLRAVLIAGSLELADIKIQPMQQNHIRHAQHWRWCIDCSQSDFEQFGTTYWHVNHQIPSMLVCDRHRTPLVSQCDYCGFVYKNLKRHWLPPKDGHCLECKRLTVPQTQGTVAIYDYLGEISLGLQAGELQIVDDSLRHSMRQRIGFDSLPKRSTLAMRKTNSKLQQKFNEWLPDDLLEIYFLKNREHALKPSNPLLKLTSAAYRQRSYPPLCALLMLIFLELDEELLGDFFCEGMKGSIA